MGLILKRGILVAATIIAAAGRPLSDQIREELEFNPSFQTNTDADATNKNGTRHVGYKGHIGVDVGSKIATSATTGCGVASIIRLRPQGSL